MKNATLFSTCTAILFFMMIAVCKAQNQQAVDSLRRAINIHTQQDTLLIRIFLKYSNAIAFENTDSAMKYADAALYLSQSLKWQTGIALGLRQKGLVYYYMSDLQNAMDCFQKSLQAGRHLQDKLFDASVYNNIADIYADLGQSEKALSYYNKLLDLSRVLKSKQNETIALVNIGTIYIDQDDMTKGIQYFKQGMLTALETNDSTVAALCLSNIGISFKEMKVYDSARSYLHESIAMAEKTSSKNTKATALTQLAQVYVSLRDYNKAENYALNGLALSKELNHVEWQANAYKALSNVYEKENKRIEALTAYKNYMALYDSILSDNKRSEIMHLEVQYEFERRQDSIKAITDKQQALAKAEIEKQHVINNSLLAGTGFLFLAGFAGFYLYKRNRDIRAQKNEAELNVHVAETEMKALRAQMNPHFIFNSLNSISDYIDKNQTRLASDYTVKFAKLMRMVLENSEQKEIPLANDLKALALYMQLESLRLNNKFSYEIEVDETIDQENTLVPPLILQPFVENSIWHGIAKKPEGGHITIYIKQESNMLRCIVEDDGGGLKSEPSGEAKKSLGMHITRARIDIINKLKNVNASMNVYNKDQGVRAEVKLPLELSF